VACLDEAIHLAPRQVEPLEAQVHEKEPVFQAEAVRVAPENVTVSLEGYGTVRARSRVNISAEVTGRIIQLSPNVKEGQVVQQGETLFRIDPRDYEIAASQAQSEIERLQAEQQRLRTGRANDKRRLEVARRSLELAKSDFDRVKNLYGQDQIGTQAGVEQAERSYNQQREAVIALESALSLYPIQLQENQSRMGGAEATLQKAGLNQDRTTVNAEFRGRVAFEDLELNQVVSPGKILLTLVNDSVLEIPVSLDSKEAQTWLPLATQQQQATWFAFTDEPPAEVRWMQDSEDRVFKGRITRVESFDASTRTLVVVVEVRSEDQQEGEVPLVEGMFCRVDVPGKEARDVYRLPATAVSHEGNVVCAKESRMNTKPVHVLLRRESEVLVGSGLQPGDIVVTSKLAKTIDGASLELTFPPDSTMETQP